MAKGGGGASTGVLRVSGILFTAIGGYHVLRYLTKDELRLFQLTYFGSLVAGIALLLLASRVSNQPRNELLYITKLVIYKLDL